MQLIYRLIERSLANCWRRFFQDIKCQASWYEQPLRLSHYRDRDGVELDIVIEKGTTAVAGIEIKFAPRTSSLNSPSSRIYIFSNLEIV